jgi:hypothetical protein
MYLAGRASVASSARTPSALVPYGWGWPVATVAMAALALWFGALRMMDPGPRTALPSADPGAVVEALPQAKGATASGGPDLVPRDVPPRSQRFDNVLTRRQQTIRRRGATLTYLEIRDIALTEGIDALPRPAALEGGYAREPKTAQQLLDELLPARPGRGLHKRGTSLPYVWPFLLLPGEPS